MPLYPTAAKALAGAPVSLGGACKWDINVRTQGKKVMVSAGLKDTNGSTLRTLSGPSGSMSPKLTLLQEDKAVKNDKMTFG